MPESVSTRSAYKMLTCIYLCRTLLFFAPYADFYMKNGFVPLNDEDVDSATRLLYFDLNDIVK